MKRVLCFALVLTALFGFSALQSFAKGGGHGGGHGGHHGGHHHSHHHSHHGHHSHHHVAHHGHHHHHFSHDWHHHHGGTWGWGDGGFAWGNPWAAPAYGTAATWLGLSALNNSGNVAVENNTTNDALAAQEESTQPEDASELAASGVDEPGADAKFMPLGVYSLAPKGQKEAVALLHLAVSKDGTLRGTYYDLKSDKDENIVGAVDKEDGMLAWTLGTNGKTVYHAWLQDLTDPPGPVTIKSTEGKTQVWTAARYTEKDEKQAFDEGHKKPKHRKETQVNQ